MLDADKTNPPGEMILLGRPPKVSDADWEFLLEKAEDAAKKAVWDMHHEISRDKDLSAWYGKNPDAQTVHDFVAQARSLIAYLDESNYEPLDERGEEAVYRAMVPTYADLKDKGYL